MLYCLDTNVIIGVMRHDAQLIAKLKSLEVSDIKIPEVVRAELLLGCLKSQHPNQE